MGRECSTHGEKRYAYGILMGTPEGKRPLGTLRRIIIIYSHSIDPYRVQNYTTGCGIGRK
jgi:hypothetical protein